MDIRSVRQPGPVPAHFRRRETLRPGSLGFRPKMTRPHFSIFFYSARPTIAEYEIQLMIMAPNDPKTKKSANAFLLMISCVLVSDMSSAPGQNCLLTGYPNRRGLYTLLHLS